VSSEPFAISVVVVTGVLVLVLVLVLDLQASLRGTAVPATVVHLGSGLGLAPSLFCSAAMTVTSVGVEVAAWREENALDSNQGQLFLDVAELDAISGIVLIAVLFAVAALPRDGLTETIAWTVAWTSASLVPLALAAAALGSVSHAATMISEGGDRNERASKVQAISSIHATMYRSHASRSSAVCLRYSLLVPTRPNRRTHVHRGENREDMGLEKHDQDIVIQAV
jgi:hypothetical protein